MAVDPKQFLVNTDYEMDKIVFFSSGSIMPGETLGINHNLSFKPLVFGVCAFNEDFSDPRISPYQELVSEGFITFQFWATSSNVVLTYRNDKNGSQRLYYRLYAFEPSNTSGAVEPTNNKAKNFILNTDYNYCKLFKKGVVDGNATINHNLGYVPFVLAWDDYNFGVMPHWANTSSTTVSVTSSSVIINANDKTHYRIYYEEA